MKQLQLLSGLGIAAATSVLAVQSAYAENAKVTAVRLQQTSTGIEIILETPDGKPLQGFSAGYDRTFITDIITTQLRLPDGNTFRQDNPAPGIASITVTPLDTNSIRVKVITTETGVPTAQVQTRGNNLVVSLTGVYNNTAIQPTPSRSTDEPSTVTPTTLNRPTDEPSVVTPSTPSRPTDEPSTVTPATLNRPTGEPSTVTPTTLNRPTGEPSAVSPTTPSRPTGEPSAVTPTTPSRPTDEPSTVSPDRPPIQPRSEESIELVVIGEEPETYRVPTATTGTRTDTPIRDVPQAIQVVPQEVLEDRRVNRLEEAVRSVSSVNPTSSSIGTFETYNIRGFESTNIIRNGLRDSTNSQVPNEFANVERIEVLKGPAAVLFGQGSLGGLINITTKRPLTEPFYSLDFTAGSFNFYRGTLDLTGPLNPSRTSAYRFNFSYQNSETFVDFTEIERFFVAPVVSWDISDRTRVTVESEIVRSSFPNYRGLPAVGTVLPNPNGKIPIERNIAEPGQDFIENRVERLGYSLEHRFSENWTLRNSFRVSLYSYDQDSFFPNGLAEDNRTLNRGGTTGTSSTDSEILSTDLVGNFSTGPIDHKLLVGVELFRENLYKNEFDIFDFPSLDLFDPRYGSTRGEVTFTIDNATLTQSAGFYIQDQISLLDNLKLVLGARFDLYEQKLKDKLADSTTEQSDQAFSPRLGIVYQPIQPISLYASYSRSFNPVSGTSFDNALFEPEKGTQYEAGIKADFLNGRLSSTLAFYQLNRQNVLTPDPRDLNFSIQTGKQRSRGVELDVAGEILPGLKIIASYGYTNAEITEDNAIEVGNLLDNVPTHKFSLFTTYEIQTGDLKGLGFGLGLFYVGERQGDLDNSFELPSYFRTDAAIYYRRGNIKAALNAYNLFNTRYFESSNGSLRVFPGAPLTVQGTIGFEF